MSSQPPTTILLIRHGQTDWNLQGRWQGHTDIPLNSAGLAQARALAERLAGWPIEVIHASDLSRAAGTARILAQSTGAPVTVDACWRERHCGAFEGLTLAEIRERFPEHHARMQLGWMDPPGAEDFEVVRARLTAALDRLREEHRGHMAAVVSHGGALATLIAHVLGLGREARHRVALDGNTGLSILEDRGRGLRLALLNDTAHLEGAGLGGDLPLKV